MANSGSTRATLALSFVLDTTPATTPQNVLLNRQVTLRDWTVASRAADLDLQIFKVASGGGLTVIGRVLNGADATFFRPTQSTNNAATGFLAVGATGVIAAGETVRLAAEDADSCTGTLYLLPGDRYGATVTTDYYPNNTAALRYQA